VNARSEQLKLQLTYDDWQLLASVCHTITRGLSYKGKTTLAKETDRLGGQVDDILSAMRAEGRV